VAWLNGARGRVIGPNTLLEVFEGDTLQLSVFGKYENPKKRGNKASLFPRGGREKMVYDLQEYAQSGGINPVTVFQMIDLVAHDLMQKPAPEAYIGDALYDKDSVMYYRGKRVLNKKSENQQSELGEKLYISKEGFAEVYLINETSENVWFDNLMTRTVSSIVVQETHYDPWGLALTGLGFQASGVKVNKYLYNGKEQIQDHALRYYDYGARMYDPSIGRWGVVDPLADHPNQVDKSPYAYAWNNPVNLTDPDGRCPICPWLDAVVDVGFVVYDVGVLIHEKVTTGSTSAENWAALGADGASILVPMSVGAGQAVKATMKAVNKADNAVDAAKTVDKATDGQKTYQTYTKTNKETGEVYSGRTSGTGTPQKNVQNRDKSHHMNDKGYGPAKLDKSSPNKDAIRGREQQLIDANGGAKSQDGKSGNAINGVGPNNKKAEQYRNAAKKEFGGG
jgi:RHS repeat-associated protein